MEITLTILWSLKLLKTSIWFYIVDPLKTFSCREELARPWGPAGHPAQEGGGARGHLGRLRVAEQEDSLRKLNALHQVNATITYYLYKFTKKSLKRVKKIQSYYFAQIKPTKSILNKETKVCMEIIFEVFFKYCMKIIFL